MKASDRAILLILAMLGLAAAFYFFILAPKREEASDLGAQVTELQSAVEAAELAAATGREAKAEFDRNYRRLISLGEAVPVDADTPSLLTQLEELSVRSGVTFRSITLSSGADATGAPAPTGVSATEATAAALPIGATVGTAGLPVMPYEMEFGGGFFEIADFFGRVDAMVSSDGERTTVEGRLLTIDGFSFAPGAGGLPSLKATVTATSYLTPSEEGITDGATPSGPSPATTTPAAAPSGTETPPTTATAVAAN